MANKTAILAVRIITDSKSGVKGLDDYGTGVDKLRGRLDAVTPAAAATIGALGLIAVASGQAASAVEQSSGAVESVFKGQADAVKAMADQAASSVGLAKSQYQDLAAVIGSQLKNMGVSQDEIAGKTDNLITLGADLAATFGGSTADAVGALSSLLRGERDPIERYGVSIKQADIEAQKAAMGLTGLTGDAEKAADMQATLALLTLQTADAQGQFSRESDTAAGSAQIAAAQFEDAKAKLGEGLLPIMANAATVAADLAEKFSENTDVIIPLLAVIGSAAAAVLLINGALQVFTAIQTLATAAQWAYNVALTANPIGLVIVVIGLLIAAIVLLIANWDAVAAVAEDVWDAIVDGIQNAIKWIQDLIGWVAEMFNTGIGAIGDFFGIGGSIGVGVDYDDPGFDDVVGPSGPWPSWPSAVGGASMRPAGDVTNTFNIYGATDANAAGREVKRVVAAQSRAVGTVPTNRTPLR